VAEGEGVGVRVGVRVVVAAGGSVGVPVGARAVAVTWTAMMGSSTATGGVPDGWQAARKLASRRTKAAIVRWTRDKAGDSTSKPKRRKEL
jgi:hypothetical protein